MRSNEPVGIGDTVYMRRDRKWHPCILVAQSQCGWIVWYQWQGVSYQRRVCFEDLKASLL